MSKNQTSSELCKVFYFPLFQHKDIVKKIKHVEIIKYDEDKKTTGSIYPDNNHSQKFLYHGCILIFNPKQISSEKQSILNQFYNLNFENNSQFDHPNQTILIYKTNSLV